MADIKHFLKIKATPEKIYKAVTTQQGLSSWWAKNTIAKPETGFVNVFIFGTSRNEFKITELSSDRKVEWKCIQSIDEWMGTTVSFELEESEGATILRFAHAGWKNVTDMFTRCNYDWALFLRSLKSLCETGTGEPK